MTPVNAVPPAKSSSGHLISGVVLAVLFTVIVVVLVVNTSKPSGRTRPAGNELRVPAILAGSPIVASLRGASALADVNRLHGQTIDAVDAAVTKYQNGATLWVSASTSGQRPRACSGG